MTRMMTRMSTNYRKEEVENRSSGKIGSRKQEKTWRIRQGSRSCSLFMNEHERDWHNEYEQEYERVLG